MALNGSIWLSVAHTLALAHYCSLISLIQSLLGSQRRCHADALYPGLAYEQVYLFCNIFLVCAASDHHQSGSCMADVYWFIWFMVYFSLGECPVYWFICFMVLW